MGNLKKEVKKSFHTEMFATGLYRVLSKQYKNFKPNFGEHLLVASEQEHMHGRIFRQFYSNKYKKILKGESIWIFYGILSAHLMKPLSLNMKLKLISENEAKAVINIEKEIAKGPELAYLKVLRRILPDEIAHSKIYKETFDL